LTNHSISCFNLPVNHQTLGTPNFFLGKVERGGRQRNDARRNFIQWLADYFFNCIRFAHWIAFSECFLIPNFSSPGGKQ
jgi:hypothetical protein